MANIVEIIDGLALFNIPVDEDQLNRAIIAAQTRGFIRTEFRRLVITVPLFTTVTNVVEAPQGRVLKYIGFDRIMPDRHDALLSVSLTIDQHFVIYDEVQLTRDIDVEAVFFPFVQDQIEHEIINMGVDDSQITEDMQLLNIDKAFFDNVLSPIYHGQFEFIKKFAERVGRR